MSKLRKRVGLWASLPLSLLFKFTVWNIYVISLRSYVDQCMLQPVEIIEEAMTLLGKLVRGVNGWVKPEALGVFGLWFRFPSFPNLATKRPCSGSGLLCIELILPGAMLSRSLTASSSVVFGVSTAAHLWVTYIQISTQLGFTGTMCSTPGRSSFKPPRTRTFLNGRPKQPKPCKEPSTPTS